VSIGDRLLGIADEPSDGEDDHLRKRVGIFAGYVNVFLPFMLPAISQGLPVAWIVAVGLPAINAANLAVLARTRRFDRYVAVLILSVMVMPLFVEVALGGLGGSSASIIFAFLGPVYAILALGPRRATPWFALFIAVLLAAVFLDPLVSSRIAPQPYPQRLIWYVANLAIPLGLTFALLRYTDRRRREAQARVDELFSNAIPAAIAARLKRGEARIAETYPETTVLFADLAGFTPWARRTDPDQVVAFLDDVFSRFDEVASELGIEKIKTIGDSYMAVAGAPERRPDHAAMIVRFAGRLLQSLEAARVDGEPPLALRIGIASGPAIGGVIGRRRILFDLWGDTVNLASRMESTGIPGRIQIGESTRDLLGTSIATEPREIDVKGLGPMRTYLVIPNGAATAEPG